MFRGLKTRAVKFWKSRGAAAVEFALLAPLMLAIYLGVIELTSLLLVERKIIAATETVADLVSQESVITPDEVDDVITAARRIFDPYDTAQLTLNIASIRFNTDTGAPEIEWQRITSSSDGDSTILTQAVDMGKPGEGVVIAYLTYSHTPIFGILTGTVLLDEISFLRPRLAPVVKCSTASATCSN
ncbi:MAG: pilus assembly protein [Rhodospirillales bacterium]|nr:pilus assembly protein [Rhodospirillales bacterium]